MLLFLRGTRNDDCRDSSHRRTNTSDEIKRSWIGHRSAIHRSIKFVLSEDFRGSLIRLYSSCCTCLVALHCNRLPFVILNYPSRQSISPFFLEITNAVLTTLAIVLLSVYSGVHFYLRYVLFSDHLQDEFYLLIVRHWLSCVVAQSRVFV